MGAARNRILRKFDTLEDGRLRNSVCFSEWESGAPESSTRTIYPMKN